MKSLREKPNKDETTQAIDWRALEEKRITPPFKPAVNGLMDTKVTSMLQTGFYKVMRWSQIPHKNLNV